MIGEFRRATSQYGLSATRAKALWAVCGEEQRAVIAAACDTDGACRAVADALNSLATPKTINVAAVVDEAAGNSTDAPATI